MIQETEVRSARKRPKEQGPCDAAVSAAYEQFYLENAILTFQNEGLMQVNEDLMQRALSAFQESGGRNLDSILSSLPSGMVGNAVKVEYSLHSRLVAVASELCPQEETLPRKLAQQSLQSQSHEQSIHCRQHGQTASFSPFLLVSLGERYTQPFLSHRNELAAIVTQEAPTEQWASVFPNDSFRSDVMSTLPNSLALVKCLGQAISDISRSAKRTTRGTLFQGPNYRHFVFRYSFFKPQYF